MPEYNPQIKHAFEVADDSLQGVLGYYYFTLALKYTSTDDQMRHLPNCMGFVLNDETTGAFLHTYSWERHFRSSEFVNEMNRLFDGYESRIALISITNIFSAALSNFIATLKEKNKLDPATITVTDKNGTNEKKINQRSIYKDSLNWAYQVAKKCRIGDQKAIERLPETFGIIDNARRLRNRIVHDNGLFNSDYGTDTIKDSEGRELFEVKIHPDFKRLKENPQEKIPILLKPTEIVDFSRAHIEVLHVLHNGIQENSFDCTEPYDYTKEGKGIEWSRILRGV